MSNNIVIIQPKKGSRKFETVGGSMTQKLVKEENGQEVVQNTSQFNSERFSKSRQMFRPIWSSTQRKWLLEGYETNSDELNKLVKACKFKYPDSHPKTKQYIEEADVYDYHDPFFNHRSLKLMTEEGNTALNKDRPLDKIMLAAIKKHNRFQVGGEFNPATSGQVRYVIIDEQIDKQQRRKSRSKKLDVYRLFEKLNDDKKLKIAMAMDLVRSESMDRETVEDILFQAAEDTGQFGDGTISKQDMFMNLCQMDTEELNRRHLIGKAKMKGLLRFRSDTGWLLFGKPVGMNTEKVNDFLSSEEGTSALMRLQDAIEKD